MGDLPVSARTQRPVSRYARYIGRVGGLAFALGVGTAVLTGTGVAWAETTDAGTGNSDPAAQHSDAAPGPAKPDAESESKTNAEAESQATAETESEIAAEAESDAEAPTESSAAEASDLTEPASETEEEVDEAAPEAGRDAVGRTDRHPALRVAGIESATQTVSAEPAVEVAVTAAAVNPNPFFDNKTPTLSQNPSENTVVNGHVLGDLHPVDIDSTTLTYTATRPAFGTVVVNSNGTFDYTPGSNYAGQDTFDVTVSDAGSDFHIHGLLGLIDLFTFGIFGLSGHYKTETVFIGVQRAVVASGLTSPVDFRFLPDGRILVAEKGGAIKVVDKFGNVLAQPLLTLSVNTVGERGVSGLAVDPQFATNGHIYVAYTTAAIKDRLSQFTVIGNSAALGTEKVFLESPDTVANYHHGGGLAFGPDGKLYWGKGDNFIGANAQDLTNMYGKILRFNSDGSTPSDNPVLPAGSLPQIYAYGLRNPFRLNFTPTGRLLVADVGNLAFDELNNVTAGGNYGWPGSEGLCTSSCTGLINPIYTYPRGSGSALSAVLAYNGALFPEYQNKVFIADMVQGWMKVLTCNSTYTSCSAPQDFDPKAGTTVVLAQGPGADGGIYQLIYSTGTLLRISPAGSPPPAAVSV